jgi:hypothetical protein
MLLTPIFHLFSPYKLDTSVRLLENKEGPLIRTNMVAVKIYRTIQEEDSSSGVHTTSRGISPTKTNDRVGPRVSAGY